MANLYYYNDNGEKIGPLTPLALQALILQGQVTQETVVENDKGQRTHAKNLPGLTFPVVVPIAQTSASQTAEQTKGSFLVTVIGLLIIVAIAWAGLKIEDAYSDGDSLLSMLSRWTDGIADSTADTSEPNEKEEPILSGEEETKPLDKESIEAKIKEELAKAEQEAAEKRKAAAAKEEADRIKRENERRIADALAEQKRKEAERAEAERKRVEEEKAEAERQRKQAERDKILAEATDLWLEVRKCGFEASDYGLREYVQYGNLLLKKKLEAANTAYNNLTEFGQAEDEKKGIKAVNEEITAAKKEIAAKEFLCECFYETRNPILDNLKIMGDKSSFDLRIDSGFVPPSTRPGVGKGTLPVNNVDATFTGGDWGRLNFFVNGNTGEVKKLYEDYRKYQARIRLKNLQQGQRCPIAEILRIDIVPREE